MTILTLAEAKLGLNKTETANDTEIQSFIDSITVSIEDFVGPVGSRVVVEEHQARDAPVLALRKLPVIAVTSIVSVFTSGSQWLTADLHVDAKTGIVRRLDRGEFYLGPFTVTYTAGRSDTTELAAINMAARFIIQHLWETQRGASKRPSMGGSGDVTLLPGWGYAIPNRAAEILRPLERPTAIS